MEAVAFRAMEAVISHYPTSGCWRKTLVFCREWINTPTTIFFVEWLFLPLLVIHLTIHSVLIFVYCLCCTNSPSSNSYYSCCLLVIVNRWLIVACPWINHYNTIWKLVIEHLQLVLITHCQMLRSCLYNDLTVTNYFLPFFICSLQYEHILHAYLVMPI